MQKYKIEYYINIVYKDFYIQVYFSFKNSDFKLILETT